MPIKIVVADPKISAKDLESIFTYFRTVDEQFSPYKTTSEVSRINNGLPANEYSPLMTQILALCEQTKTQTNGYFDISKGGKIDPSGLVKGWAIQQASKQLSDLGYNNFYIDAGGDIQVSGVNALGKPWQIGIRNPFNLEEIIKVLSLTNSGVATSGAYIRGQHIYNPHDRSDKLTSVASMTVVGTDVFDADRFATAAFAMGTSGISFIESLKGFEGYMIGDDKLATMTSGFEDYIGRTI